MYKNTINPVDAYFLTVNSKTTIQSSVFRLRAFCLFTFDKKDFDKCDWRSLNYINVLSFIQNQRNENLAYSSINVSLSILKSVSMHAWQLDLISIENYMRIKTIKGLRFSGDRAGRALSIKEVIAFKNKYQCTNSLQEKRNYAIFALACGGGLRRCEISALNICDFNSDKVTVIGKGNKKRIVYLSSFVLTAVNRWFTSICTQNTSNPAFVRIFNGDKLGKRIGNLSIHRAIDTLQNNIDCSRFTTHDLRRTFATTLLDVGADKFAVQRLMGHSSLVTTELYDRRGEKASIDAIKLLPF